MVITESMKHLTEEKDFKPERMKTMKITKLKEWQVKNLLEDFTHSEIRRGKTFEGVFTPGSFSKAIVEKKFKGTRNILI